MVGGAAHELNEAGILPSLIDQVWSTRCALSETSTVGIVLKSLFGYSDQPALIQVLAYVAYLGTVGLAILQRRQRAVPPLNQPA